MVSNRLLLKEWNQNQMNIDTISINIPGIYVGSERLKNQLLEMTTKYQVSPCQLELEITETSYVDNIERATECVNQFRGLGFLVALDDFGTGVSSLSYLKELDITTLKIDKSFVNGVPYSEKDSSILEGIISLADSLKLSVVIEGVETEEQSTYLKERFTDALIQGYFYSKPLDSHELEKLYKELKYKDEMIHLH